MKFSFRTLTVSALCALSVAPVASQQRSRIYVNGTEISPFELVTGRRARIGVTLDMEAIDSDSIGATVASVTPGGPAAEAGIASGDVLTRFNGRSLVRPMGDREWHRMDGGSLAALRLIEMVAQLDPGDTVTVEYRRDGSTRTATIVTARERDLASRDTWEFADPADGIRLRSMPRISLGRSPGDFFFSFGGPMAEIELAKLNDDLGSYFGTTDGVLVIDAPATNAFGLRGGDVILSVDGRSARSPSSLLRILATYEEGEPVQFEIMRNKNRETVSAKVERDRR